MKLKTLMIVGATIALTLLAYPLNKGWSADFKCNGRIVSKGDRKAEVYFKCGEPEWRYSRTEEVVRKIREGRWVKKLVDVEEWLYNFGSTRFMRILTFYGNRLRDIEISDYGYNASDFRAGKDCLRGLERGDRQPEVVVRCGPPSFVDHYEEEHIRRGESGGLFRFNVHISEWTYDFGPDQLMRILKFENGRLVRMETSDYGYYR